MKQAYHKNATANLHTRNLINKSNKTADQLSNELGVSGKTIYKWENRETFEDISSRPHTIHYSLTEIEKEVIRVVRKLTWCPLDDLTEIVHSSIKNAKRSNVYRTLVKFGINKLPKEKKKEAKKFKEYEPGFLHIDVTYLPKLDGIKHYLFVAIDRATRVLYYELYERRTAENAEDFANKCKEFFPFYITHILTDNGLEFTNRLIKSKKGKLCKKPSKVDIFCKENNIEHRLIKPNTPKTNGMVERANGKIKNRTVKVNKYENREEMEKDLKKYLLFYIFNQRHSGLVKELRVKTPFEAIKEWYKLKPEIFKETPNMFQAKILSLLQQRGET